MKKIFAILLSLSLLLGAVPAAVFTAGADSSLTYEEYCALKETAGFVYRYFYWVIGYVPLDSAAFYIAENYPEYAYYYGRYENDELIINRDYPSCVVAPVSVYKDAYYLRNPEAPYQFFETYALPDYLNQGHAPVASTYYTYDGTPVTVTLGYDPDNETIGIGLGGIGDMMDHIYDGFIDNGDGTYDFYYAEYDYDFDTNETTMLDKGVVISLRTNGGVVSLTDHRDVDPLPEEYTKVPASSGQCGDDLYWELDENGVLTISGYGDMWDYLDEPAPWGTDITGVTIGNGATGIGDSAFEECAGLTSVAIPDSVTSIGSYAFSDCTGLTNIEIPDSVTIIGAFAFMDCTGLTSVTIPDGITSIGSEVFCGCSSLTSVTIPDSVTSIGWGAFMYCTSLTSVTIPDSVTSIGDWAFLGCSSLKGVTIPDSVTSIGDWAFHYYDGDTYEEKPLNCTLRVYENSYAHQYAIDEGFEYELIKSDVMKGDPDGDGEITVSDSLYALRIAAKLTQEKPEDIAICDVDGDGKITVADALKILRVAAKLISSLD